MCWHDINQDWRKIQDLKVILFLSSFLIKTYNAFFYMQYGADIIAQPIYYSGWRWPYKPSIELTIRLRARFLYLVLTFMNLCAAEVNLRSILLTLTLFLSILTTCECS
jgi:hypothetical protein